MSKPLTVVLQLAALFLLFRGYATENPVMYLLAAACFIPAAIAIRKRMKR